MVLRGIPRVVQRMRNDFLDCVVDWRIRAVELTVQLLNAISVVADVELAETDVLERYSVLHRVALYAVT